MTLIHWKDAYSTGVASIDHEHRELIGIINELAGSIDDACSADEARDYLTEIQEKIAAHFALEEAVMRTLKYDRFGAHKGDHDRLLDEIGDIVESVEKDKAFQSRATLGETLNRWFAVHFATFDVDIPKQAAKPI